GRPVGDHDNTHVRFFGAGRDVEGAQKAPENGRDFIRPEPRLPAGHRPATVEEHRWPQRLRRHQPFLRSARAICCPARVVICGTVALKAAGFGACTVVLLFTTIGRPPPLMARPTRRCWLSLSTSSLRLSLARTSSSETNGRMPATPPEW